MPISSEYIEKALRTLAAVYECYKDDNNSIALQKYIIDKAQYWGAFTALAMLYNIIAIEYFGISNYKCAKEYLQLANEAYNEIKTQDTFVQELQYNIFFNLGKAWKYFSVNESIKYFTLAQTLMPNNQDTVLELLKHYIGCQDDKKCSEQLGKITDQDIRGLYSILQTLEMQNLGFQSDFNIATSLKLQATSTQDRELKKLHIIMSEFESQSGSTISQLCTTHGFMFPEHGDSKASKYTLYIEIWAKHFLQQKAFTKAIDCWLELNNHRVQHNIPIHLFNILEICKKAEYWEKGLKYIKDIYALYPDLSNHTMLPLKYLEFIFYEANKCQQQSKDCWDFLKTHAKSGDIASKLFSYAEDFAFYTAIENGNLNKAFQYFLPPVPNPNIAVLDCPVTDVVRYYELSRKVDKEVIKARLLLEKLQQKIINLATEQASSGATAETNFTNDIITIDLTEDTNKLSKIIDTLDHKAINAYFQDKKRKLLKESVETTVKAPPPCVWNTQTGIYSSDQKDVYPVEGTKNFYATINPKLFDSLVPELRDQFTKALPYLIGRDHKSNGIKTIHKRLIELKIPKKDYRLYTKHIYKNDQDEYLIEFDHCGRHPDVQKQMTGKSSWKVITCEDKVSCTPNILKEVKETETSYSVQHITKEMKHVSVSEEEWGVKLSGNDDVTQKDSHL